MKRFLGGIWRGLDRANDRKWINAGALIIAPMIAAFAIFFSVGWVRVIPDIPGILQWENQRDAPGEFYVRALLLFTEMTVLIIFAFALCGFTIWLGTVGYRLILSEMRFDRDRAFALMGIGLLSASWTAFYLPSFFPGDLKTLTYPFGLVWVPAGLIVLASLAAFFQTRSFAWDCLCYLPLIPLVVVSLHENVWYAHRGICPSFWLLKFQGPWVLSGFCATYIGLLAIAANAWWNEDVEVRRSGMPVVLIVAIVLFIELLGASEIWFRWLEQTWTLVAVMIASLGLLAIVVRVWRRESVGSNKSALAALISLPPALLAGLFIFSITQSVQVSDCGIPIKSVRNIVGPFYW